MYQLGIKPDWWKLPGLKAVTWQQLTAVISANDPYCRGVLILGLDAPESVFDETFKEAANADIVKDLQLEELFCRSVSQMVSK